MAEVTQYTFSWSEVTETLIKKQNIHEGKWIAAIEFGVNAGVFGGGMTYVSHQIGVVCYRFVSWVRLAGSNS